mmetsp:Transcript_2164/g.5454  ORF Transcript_2164/g.5454 Transcript_2164/m.5454 type:complete len:222 (-) Transcript_2164:100-765(-)
MIVQILLLLRPLVHWRWLQHVGDGVGLIRYQRRIGGRFALQDSPVRLHLPLAFGRHRIFTRTEPVLLSEAGQLIDRVLRQVDAIGGAAAFHARRSVDCIAEQLESGLFTSQHARRDRSGMDTESHGQLGRVRTKRVGQLVHQRVHLRQALAGKSKEEDRVIIATFGQTAGSHVTVPDRFDLEDLESHGNLVEGVVDCFEEREDFGRFSGAGPGSKSHHIRK